VIDDGAVVGLGNPPAGGAGGLDLSAIRPDVVFPTVPEEPPAEVSERFFEILPSH